MSIKIVTSTVEKWAARYDGGKFHAMICDPPYHLTTITDRFGGKDSAPAKYGDDGLFQRASAGFMGMTWDGGDVAFSPITWSMLGEHMYDGAFGMAFSGSRTWHRLAVAIEDAGMVIHPTIFCWTYASGFPKATRVDNQIDRMMGTEDERTGTGNKHVRNVKPYDDSAGWNKNNTEGDYEYEDAAHPLARAFQGHRYGLQALKPATEPIIVFQKPYNGRPIENIVDSGAGTLNIDATRIGINESVDDPRLGGKGEWAGTAVYSGGYAGDPVKSSPMGRWPANFVLVHHWDCVFKGYASDDYVINRFDDGAKPFGGGAGHEYTGEDLETRYEVWECHPDCPCARLDRQSSDSSRFFYQASLELEKSDPFIYVPKASTAEREAGLSSHKSKANEDKRQRLNPHPTAKPIGLAKYLAKMLLPPGEYSPRRIMVPFAGVGSEMIGCWQAGWDDIVGIEMHEEYADIAKLRIDHWVNVMGSQLELKI